MLYDIKIIFVVFSDFFFFRHLVNSGIHKQINGNILSKVIALHLVTLWFTTLESITINNYFHDPSSPHYFFVLDGLIFI